MHAASDVLARHPDCADAHAEAFASGAEACEYVGFACTGVAELALEVTARRRASGSERKDGKRRDLGIERVSGDSVHPEQRNESCYLDNENMTKKTIVALRCASLRFAAA
jgi:hypothetical protein